MYKVTVKLMNHDTMAEDLMQTVFDFFQEIPAWLDSISERHTVTEVRIERVK